MTKLARFDNRLSRYLVVGVISTATHFGALILLVERFAMGILAATALAFCASLLVSFALNYLFAFRANTPVIDSFVRFTLVTLAGLSLNMGTMELLVNRLEIHYIIANCVAIILVTANNFSLHLLWTFKHR
jgi:dolichol-phosphate mannosyltransferase